MATHHEVIVRRASIAVPILALALSLACGHDSSTDPNNASLGGVYSLSTVNGTALPFTVANGTTSVTLTSDVLTVTDAGGWSEAFAIRVTQNGTSANQTGGDTGTWTRTGASVTFTSATGGTAYTGTFTGGGFTLSDGAFSYAFAK
jgi:hypothetical protein